MGLVCLLHQLCHLLSCAALALLICWIYPVKHTHIPLEEACRGMVWCVGYCRCLSGRHARQALVTEQFLDPAMHTSSEKQANAGPTQKITTANTNTIKTIIIFIIYIYIKTTTTTRQLCYLTGWGMNPAVSLALSKSTWPSCISPS